MSKVTDLVIIGAGGLGREIFSVCEAANRESRQWNVLGFVDDRAHGEVPDSGLQVLGGQDWIERNAANAVHFICAVGNTRIRKRLVQQCKQFGGKFSTVVHPDVVIPSRVEVGAGSVIMAGTRFTTNVRIGSHAVIYLNCSLTHDVVIGDYSVVTSGCNLAGAVVLEEGVYLGTGTAVIEGRRVGAGSVIGAGSVVIRDVPPGVTAAGVPCRVLKEHADKY